MKRDITSREGLIENFPFAYKCDKDMAARCIDTALTQTTARSMVSAIHEIVDEYQPEATHIPYKDKTEEQKKECMEWFDWRYDALGSWIECVVSYAIGVVGYRHTRDEALDIVTKFWIERIFKAHFQDNGAFNQPHGFGMMALGTILQRNAQDSISDEVVNKAQEGIREHYKSNLGKYNTLSCDYGPCKELYDILKDAGVPENKISNICPWKTDAAIDTRDFSVNVRDGYGNFKTL